MAQKQILRIVLTGFMGAGKSTLGSLLARELGWRFVDADDELVRSHGISVADMFEQIGEGGFRQREEEMVRGLLVHERMVLALGGGALESAATRDRLHGSAGTHIIFLETPLTVALARCVRQQGGAVRPVLLDETLLTERFLQRMEHYREAHRVLHTEGHAPGELVRLLVADLALQV